MFQLARGTVRQTPKVFTRADKRFIAAAYKINSIKVVEKAKTDEEDIKQQGYREYAQSLPAFDNQHYQQFLKKADEARAKDLTK